jgi:hypothetical protein
MGSSNRADVEGIVAMLSEPASFSIPPLPTLFRGRVDIAAFIRGRIFQLALQARPISLRSAP